jgi:geranylgeranyl pyrophosphate synthase
MKPPFDEYQRIERAVLEVKVWLERLLERRLPEPARRAVCPLRGKLNRARLVLTFAALGGAIRPQALQIACGVELLHMASLMQDDIVDDAQYRQGRRAVFRLVGTGAAVLLSDWLFGQAYDCFDRSHSVALKEVNRLVKVMALSELRQEIPEGGKIPVSVFHCLRYNLQKTALFFQLCCELGVDMVPCGRQVRWAAGKTGLYWGMAYQLRNDLEDLESPNGTNPVSSDQDRAKGLFTLPLVLLLSRRPEFRAELGEYSTAELNRMLIQNGIIKECRCLQKRYLIKAEQYLAAIDLGGQVPDLIRSRLRQMGDAFFPATGREAVKH